MLLVDLPDLGRHVAVSRLLVDLQADLNIPDLGNHQILYPAFQRDFLKLKKVGSYLDLRSNFETNPDRGQIER